MRPSSPSPRRALVGPERAPGMVAPQTLGPDDRKMRAETPLSFDLPQAFARAAWWWQIAVPIGQVFTAGMSAWFGLRRLRVGVDVPQCALAGATFIMLPCDSAGAGFGGTPGIAWGDARGISAAVVVDRGLHWVQVGAWTSGPANLPAIETAGLGTNPDSPRDYLIAQGYPPGLWSDTTPNKWEPITRTLPLLARLPVGDVLDVAVVFNSAQIAAGGVGGGDRLRVLLRVAAADADHEPAGLRAMMLDALIQSWPIVVFLMAQTAAAAWWAATLQARVHRLCADVAELRAELRSARKR